MVGGGGAPFGASSVDASAASSKAVAIIKDAEMLTALSEARTNPTTLAAAIHSRKQHFKGKVSSHRMSALRPLYPTLSEL
jgi:hypothetical protein